MLAERPRHDGLAPCASRRAPSHKRVDPSISVNTNVTVPDGTATPVVSHTPPERLRNPGDRLRFWPVDTESRASRHGQPYSRSEYISVASTSEVQASAVPDGRSAGPVRVLLPDDAPPRSDRLASSPSINPGTACRGRSEQTSGPQSGRATELPRTPLHDVDGRCAVG